MANFETLPVEMICHVLSFLTLPEQMKLAIVCRRWREAADACLARRRFFCITDLTNRPRMTNELLEKILSRLGGLHYLSNVAGRDFDPDLDLDIISRHCPHLRNVDTAEFQVDVPKLERLCRSCPNLTQISLSGCDDDCVAAVFRGLPGLRSLELDVSSITGRCLALLPDGLQRLTPFNVPDEIPAELNRAVPCLTLTELNLSLMGEEEEDLPWHVLSELLVICPRLERITSGGFCFGITDYFLKRLPEMTPGIRTLDLVDCPYLGEHGLKHLSRLKELRSLNLLHTYTTDRALEHLCGAFNLTELVIGPMPYIGPAFSEEMLARFVVSCPSLRYVKISPMIEGNDLIDHLIDQLTPDRDVTLHMNAHNKQYTYALDDVPEDGPLSIEWWD